MTDSISIELKESPSHAFLDVAVTIMGETNNLNTSFTHSDRSTANHIVAELQKAAERVSLKENGDSIIVETSGKLGCSDMFAIKASEGNPRGVIFEHVKSLTKLNGLKFV